MTLAPLRVARGMAAPASATAPPLARRGAACAGGWPFLAPPSRLRRPRLGSGWNSLAGARSPCASGFALGVKIGGVLRGVLPRSLGRLRRLRPAGFGWGRARRCGTRQPAASPTPPPIRARPDTLRGRGSLTRVVQIRRNGGFPTPLVRPRLPSPFFVKIGRSGAVNGPRALNFAKKRAPKALQGRLQLVRQPPDHLLNGGLPARRGLWTAPGTVPTARTRSGLGSGLRPSAAWSPNPLGIITAPRL